MTPDQKHLKERLDHFKQQKAMAEKKIAELSKTCTHHLREITAEEFANPWMSVLAKCEICGKHFGWRCKEAPDKICHYFSTKHPNMKVPAIKLIDDKYDLTFPQDKWSKEAECEEECLYCGMPKERG